MATFYETKQLLCRLLGSRNIEDNDEDVYYSPLRTPSSEMQECRRFVISNAELKELYDKVCAMHNNELELYNEGYYEIAIDLGYQIRPLQELSIASEDISNGIQYEIGYPTLEYSLYLLMLIKDEMNKQQVRNKTIPPNRLRIISERRLNNKSDYSLATILPVMIGEFSLKIKTTNVTARFLSDYTELKTSFMFEFMYKTEISLVEFLNIVDMFPMNNTMRGRTDVIQIETPPLRKYSEDVVDYYKQALASNDPYIKFISFYHVMEYFFDEVFKRKMVTDLKNKITHPDFSYKNDTKVYEIAMFVKNRLRMNDEICRGNELEALQYVLSEFVSINNLKTRIEAIDINAVQYYQNNKVAFCNASIINWSNKQKVLSQIARRIYITRNSLVHSKSGKNQERYRPYKDEKQLQLEIPLVKAVAEAIIINSSEII